MNMYDVIDDATVEGDEVICVHIEHVGGTATLSETGNTYALLTVNDNDNTTDHTLIISLSVSATVLIGVTTIYLLYRRRLIKSYIPIRKAVEISKCSVKVGVTMMRV